MNIASSSYILIALFALLLAPANGMDFEVQKLRGTRFLVSKPSVTAVQMNISWMCSEYFMLLADTCRGFC